MKASKVYGVYDPAGVVSGIYDTWDEAQNASKGVAGEKHKSFASREDAQNWIDAQQSGVSAEVKDIPKEDILPTAVAQGAQVYVDGSYNKNTNGYGYGVFVTEADGMSYVMFGSGQCKEGGNNVEGEVAGISAFLRERENPLSKYYRMPATVYYDYEGIRGWSEEWSANLNYTKAYKSLCSEILPFQKINMVWAKGHSGVVGNEVVDRIAKLACGVPIAKKDYQFLEDNIGSAIGYQELMTACSEKDQFTPTK